MQALRLCVWINGSGSGINAWLGLLFEWAGHFKIRL
jgi:hypothetical protein